MWNMHWRYVNYNPAKKLTQWNQVPFEKMTDAYQIFWGILLHLPQWFTLTFISWKLWDDGSSWGFWLLSDALVKVFTAQVGVTVGGHNLKNAIVDGQQGHIESTSHLKIAAWSHLKKRRARGLGLCVVEMTYRYCTYNRIAMHHTLAYTVNSLSDMYTVSAKKSTTFILNLWSSGIISIQMNTHVWYMLTDMYIQKMCICILK